MRSITSGRASTALYSSLVPMRRPWRLMVASLRPKITQPVLPVAGLPMRSQSPWRQTPPASGPRSPPPGLRPWPGGYISK